MIRQRLYNPAHLTPDELKESFVARSEALAEMLRLIGEQTPGHPCQHMILIGPRGMGKTTLGLRFLHSIAERPDLREHWQPVAFHEESYGIVNLADFWIHALRHLTRATGEGRWEDRAGALERDESDVERLAAYALDALLDFSEEHGKRLILFVENIDSVFGQMHDEREIHLLRATLIERPEVLLLGSANAFFEAIRGYGEPLYEFFRVVRLEGIGQEDARRILKAAVEREGRSGVSETLTRDQGRLETIRRLTGGNPRLLVLACRLLIESPLGAAMEDLERLIDEQTPYFKARVEELPVQARKVFHCLSEGWQPMLAKDVAGAAKLSSSHASAQLKQLLERGYVRELRLPGEKRIRYEVGDRFYNIYFLLRFSRTGRDRLERLVAFLHDLFGASGMRALYPAALATLRANGGAVAESEWLLGVLARHVARDPGFEGRDNWRRQAVAIVVERIGPDSPVVEEIVDAFEHQPNRIAIHERIQHSKELSDVGRFVEAEAVLREAVASEPRHGLAWLQLGLVLVEQRRYEPALSVLERAEAIAGTTEQERLLVLSLTLRGAALISLERYDEALVTVQRAAKCTESGAMTSIARQSFILLSLARGLSFVGSTPHEEAIDALHRGAELVRTDDTAKMRSMAAECLKFEGVLLSKLNRDQEAVDVRIRALDYVRADDLEESRRIAVEALAANGHAQFRGGEYEDAVASLERMTGYVLVEDSAELRHMVTRNVIFKGLVLLQHGAPVGLTEACQFAATYLNRDDPPEIRRPTAELMASGGVASMFIGNYEIAESVFRTATEIDSDVAESWASWARVILLQRDAKRLPIAEEYARRAVELEPDDPRVSYILSEVLAYAGKWTTALMRLEHALRVGGSELREQEGHGLTELLIRAARAGHGERIKRMLEAVCLVEPMEPLWLAVRAELGETIEPQPAEVMDAVSEVRRRLSGTTETRPA